MPSRVHWVYMAGPGTPRFDATARAFFQDHLRRKIQDTMLSIPAARLRNRIDRLPPSFRKALPSMLEIATELNLPMSKKLRQFRLPKKLRRNKNPIFSWRNAA